MKRSQFGVLYLTVFVDLLGFGIILPVLPFYAQSFGATGLGVGGILAAYSVAQLIGASILGRLSDRVGRRPVILFSLLGSCLSFTLIGFAHTYWWLLIGRALAGSFGGSISAAQAAIADVTTPNERAKYMGLLGACIGMGFVFGPALGAMLASRGFGAASFVAAGIAGVNLLYAFWKLPETRTKASLPTIPFSLGALGGVLKKPATMRLFSVAFLGTFAFVAMETTFALLGEKKFDIGSREMGWIFTLIGVVMAIVQGGLIGRVVKAIGEKRTALGGALLMALALLLLPLTPTLGFCIAALCLLGTGQGFMNPSLSTMISQNSSADEQGGNLGISQSLGAAARAVGPMVSGALFDKNMALPYFMAAFVMGGAALVLSSLPRVRSR